MLDAFAALNRLPRSSRMAPSERMMRCTRSASSPGMIEPTCGSTSRLFSAPAPKSSPYTATFSGRRPVAAAIATVRSTVDLPEPLVP